jgi:hypothetical protein
MKKTETLNLRVSPEFKRRLMHEAARQKRSVTNYLEVTLTGFWAGRDIGATEDDSRKRPAPAKTGKS